MQCVKDGLPQGCFPMDTPEGIFSPQERWGGAGTSALLGRREVFCDCRFDEQLPRLQDFELLLRIAEKYTVCYLDRLLVTWSIRADSISADPGKGLRAVALIRKKHTALLKKYPKVADELQAIAENYRRELRDYKRRRVLRFFRR